MSPIIDARAPYPTGESRRTGALRVRAALEPAAFATGLGVVTAPHGRRVPAGRGRSGRGSPRVRRRHQQQAGRGQPGGTARGTARRCRAGLPGPVGLTRLDGVPTLVVF
ncbi:hypothetical protein V2I01_25210 [Micromonospora sp. BRA006-A]|nr:hypothetical protein [Micromonospora sp. BRA006-A]